MPHKLLLADDSVTIQRVIELTFADEDVQVVAVGDGKKAIASIQSDRPDIVLADVGMPERDGYEVAAFIKGNPQFASIPVLLLTGAFEPIDETRARAVGCDGVLVKPFEPQMVINRVKDLLAGRRSSGLWGANQTAQTPIRQTESAPAEKGGHLQPPVSLDAKPPAGGSLEDYFDRLDAAFASVEGAIDAQPGPVATATPARSTAEPAAPAAQAGPPATLVLPPDDLGSWDPDLAGDPERVDPIGAAPPPTPPQAPSTWQAPPTPTPTPSPADQVAPAPSAVLPGTPAQSPREATARPVPAPEAPQMASLAEAFAALLSAEQSRPIAASTIGASSVSDDTVEAIVQRVISRMGDQSVRETVIDVAERLVREEIERIKKG